ncbi:MAG: lytic transglycosylase domain-containing protein [Acidobacteriota bacterium]
MQAFITLSVCCAFFFLFLSAPLTFAQADKDNDSSERRVLNNFDFGSRSVVQSEKTSPPESSPAPTKSTGKVSRKKAIVKKAAEQPAAKGEGYYQEEPAKDTQSAAPAEPKIYSELRTTIDDDGKLVLTSDTIVVKPEIVALPETLRATESTGNKQIDGMIENAARKYSVDPRLILEVMRQESGFRTKVVSHKGACGLMQLIPSTARRFGVTSIYDPAQNVEGGTRYLRFLLDMFKGNVELALAGYNAGENAVVRNNYKIPRYRETQDYVRSITARYRSKYHQIAEKKPEPMVVRNAPLTTFQAEGGRVILSNNY